MRRISTALMLIGLTATVVAQTPQTRTDAMTMEGGRIVANGTVMELSGGVKFTINGVQVTADEATMDRRTQEVTLRGNVRMKLLK